MARVVYVADRFDTFATKMVALLNLAGIRFYRFFTLKSLKFEIAPQKHLSFSSFEYFGTRYDATH